MEICLPNMTGQPTGSRGSFLFSDSLSVICVDSLELVSQPLSIYISKMKTPLLHGMDEMGTIEGGKNRSRKEGIWTKTFMSLGPK